MARHRSHSVEFKRQVADEFPAGENLLGLAKRHDISRDLIRIWLEKYEVGALGDDARAADLIQAFKARIAALERLVGKLGPKISGETLRQWMTAAGLWLSKKQRRWFLQPRLRRELMARSCRSMAASIIGSKSG